MFVFFGFSCLCFWHLNVLADTDAVKKNKKTDPEDTVQTRSQTREEEITYADPIFYKRNVQKSEDEVVYAGVVTRR
ncbi:hypothetical protein Q8A67_005656 [Cirrhinus molitorella]|uniref:Secreted protein n=1 Tax=Cirrhinus molitorella TaxID=172907 RepID=A0AA88U2C7_9TELE|nr:hypothetical protein Q8A67_005656 [Cirrhinus molitorella]